MVASLTYTSFDPNSKDDISQLSRALGYSRKTLKVFRDNRLALIREFVGRNYSNNGATDRVPINLLELSMNIYLQRLAAQSPQVDISTDIKKLREISDRFEIAGNHLLKEIDLGKTLQAAVTGGMLSLGIVKVGMNRTQVELGGVLHDSGQPFADYVSLDNYVQDMTVDKGENGQYEGDFYFTTIDEAVAAYPDFGESKFPRYNENPTPEKRDHNISEGEESQREDFRDVVRFLDVWLPKYNLLLICTASDDENDPIQDVVKIIKWDGPERGPYHKLGFTYIENNTMPVAPAAHWRDLHELSNNLLRKLGRQATREKTVIGVRTGGDKDGNRILDANDGDMIALDDPKNVGEYKFGGISSENLGFLIMVKDLFSYLGGNLDMLGGLGPQSETLGQDQLLSASASMRIQKMQKSTLEFTTGIIKDLLYYLWTDPYITLPAVKRVKGFDDVMVDSPIRAEERENDFAEYNLSIEPYSMQHQTPESKMQGLRTIMQEFISPLLPMMDAQGITVDLEKLFRTIGKFTNIKELNEILVYSNPNHEPQAVGQPPSKTPQAPVTKRTYERINRPGATQSGKDQILQQALLGSKPQNKGNASTLLRPTG